MRTRRTTTLSGSPTAQKSNLSSDINSQTSTVNLVSFSQQLMNGLMTSGLSNIQTFLFNGESLMEETIHAQWMDKMTQSLSNLPSKPNKDQIKQMSQECWNEVFSNAEELTLKLSHSNLAAQQLGDQIQTISHQIFLLQKEQRRRPLNQE